MLTVETMSRIAEQAEKSIDYTERFHNTHFRIRNEMDAISHTVCGMSMDLEAKAIVVASVSGKTVRMVSRFRSPVDIVGLSVDERTFHQLSLSWGVLPVMCELYPSQEVLFYSATKIAKQVLDLQKGDKVIITGSSQMNAPGATNTIRFETV